VSKLIELTQGMQAIVDDADFDELSKFKWNAHRDGKGKVYVTRKQRKIEYGDGVRREIKMHRQIMGFPEALVDHRNGNGLDNRRENLRCANHQQNGANQSRAHKNSLSGIKGVSRAGAGWRARIRINGKLIERYGWKTAEAARAWYNRIARTAFGEFAA